MSWGPLVLYLLVLLVAAYAIFGLVLLFTQRKLLFRPTRDVAYTPADLDLEFEEAAFTSPDGVRITGWYVPAPNARYTILFCHGNAGNIAHRLDSVHLFHRLGLNCLVFDYRGYGRSEGKPGERGSYRDARAAFDWLTEGKGIPAERVVLFGRSLGGSVAAHLATQIQPAALVVENAFTSYPDIAARCYPYMPVRPFALFRLNTLASVRKVSCPVMVVHSRDDRLVPFRHGQKLFKAANEPKKFVVTHGGHNDSFLVSGDLYREAWRDWTQFLAETEPRKAVHQAS
jgi:hypothetical protein